MSPWRGLEVGGDATQGQTLRSLRLADGVYTYRLGDGWRSLERDGQLLLRTDARGRLPEVRVGGTDALLFLPPQEREVTVQWPSLRRDRLVALTVEGAAMVPDDGDAVTVRLGPAKSFRRIVLLYQPA